MKYNKRSVNGIRFYAFLTIAILVMASCNNKPKNDNSVAGNIPGASAGKGYSDSSSSSVKVFDQNGRVCIQQSNTSYEVVNISEVGGKIPLLLKIKKTELCYADSVNGDKVYEITAKTVLDSKPINWSVSFVATDISFKDNTLLAVKEGNGDEHDFIRRFSLQNGSEVFSCSFSDLEVKIPNVINKYFIGYTSKKAATNPLALLKEENIQGVVRLGSSLNPIDSFKVKLKRSKVVAKIATSVPDIILVAANDNTRAIDDGKTIILMKGDTQTTSKDISDLSVKFTYYFGDDNESTDITVPVVNGKFDIAHAQYDKDIFELGTF